MNYAVIIDRPDPKTPCKCGACGEINLYQALAPIHDCLLRPGDASPAGRCPDCEALCYVIKDAMPQPTKDLAAFEAMIVDLTNGRLARDTAEGRPDQPDDMPARRRALLELMQRAQGMLDREDRAKARVLAGRITREVGMMLAIAFGEQKLPYVISVRRQAHTDDAVEIVFVAGKKPLPAIRFRCDEDCGTLMTGDTPPYRTILEVPVGECTSLVAAHRIATVFRNHLAGRSEAAPITQAMGTAPTPGEVTEYRVEWSIELDGNSPLDAARVARATQLDPASTGNVFKVSPATDPEKVIVVDLDQDPPKTCEA